MQSGPSQMVELMMSPFDQRWIKALAHPVRIGILRHLLDNDEATPTALAAALGVPTGRIVYHVRRLSEAEQLVLAGQTLRRGAVAHYYRLKSPEATREALRRVGLAVQPLRATAVAPTDPWYQLRRALSELRRRRQAQGISRDALARNLRIKTSQLARIERAETDPHTTVLMAIAHELGTTLGEVFTAAEL